MVLGPKAILRAFVYDFLVVGAAHLITGGGCTSSRLDDGFPVPGDSMQPPRLRRISSPDQVGCYSSLPREAALAATLLTILKFDFSSFLPAQLVLAASATVAQANRNPQTLADQPALAATFFLRPLIGMAVALGKLQDGQCTLYFSLSRMVIITCQKLHGAVRF